MHDHTGGHDHSLSGRQPHDAIVVANYFIIIKEHMEMNKAFDVPAVRSGCSKSELAQAYFPQIENEGVARRNLIRWIERNPELTQRLTEAGYSKRQRYYTPLQVSIIYEILGTPN